MTHSSPVRLLCLLFVTILLLLPATSVARHLFTLEAGSQVHQVFNDVMEGGVPYGPVSAVTNDGISFYIGEPFRNRIAIFDNSGKYLRQIKFPELQGLSRLFFLDNGLLVAVTFLSNSDVRAYVLRTDGSTQAVLEPALMIYDGRRILDFEPVSGSRVMAVLDSGAFLYAGTGDFIAMLDSPVLDSSDRIYKLSGSGEGQLLQVSSLQGELLGKWPVPQDQGRFADSLRVTEGGVCVFRRPVPRGEPVCLFIDPLTGRLIRRCSASELVQEKSTELRMVRPYPRGNVEIHDN